MTTIDQTEYIPVESIAVRVDQTSAFGWIVRDPREPDSIGNVLGCIERSVEGFELMKIGDGFTWHTYRTLDEAVEHAAEGLGRRRS
jgi:hypothetical protein